MSNYAFQAIQSAINGSKVFCKFLSANDTGATGGHQAGIYISKPSISILFETSGIKGQNKERSVKIKWQNDFETDSVFKYYGQGSRNEYRITKFGRNFPFLTSEYTGALFILVESDKDYFLGYILNSEDDINQFLDTFNICPTETNCLLHINDDVNFKAQEKIAIEQFISSLEVDFPNSEFMSSSAREMEDSIYDHSDLICTDPDTKLISWTNFEYKLFRALEQSRYGHLITNGFSSLEEFLVIANQVLNRRKSRAGKSLEHHLSAIFDKNNINYQYQAVTEGNKRPDFLFPSQVAYRSLEFPTDKLVTLAAKTTCKDRWRQVINEASRLKNQPKFLCTLQQGISAAQIDEMQTEKVVLVVPKPYISAYPKEYRSEIWTVKKFVEYIKELEK